MTYARITTVDHNGIRLVGRYEILSESGAWLRARLVDAEGNDVASHYDGDTLVDVVHLIDVGAITKRVPLVMNRKYATIEEAK